MSVLLPTPRLLKAIRQASGETQESLARRLGVSFPTLNQWERGHREPRASHRFAIERIATELNIARELSVLMIDDDAQDCLFVEHLINNSPAAALVTSVTDPIEGLLQVGNIRPDILILDIRMPGLNGIEVAERARTIPGLEKMQIVFLTGAEEGKLLEKARATGAMVLSKPPSQSALDAILAAANISA